MSDNYLPDDEVTLALIKDGDETISVRPMLDFLRRGIKSGKVFPLGERSIIANELEGNIVFEYEDTSINNSNRELLVVTNGDLLYGCSRIYAGSRRFVDDFWDVADEERLPVHMNSEDRLFDFTESLKHYAVPEVWKDLIERVVGAQIVDEPHARKLMLGVHRHACINSLLFERGVSSFVSMLDNHIPQRMEVIVEFYIVLRITSRRFTLFFEREREETLGEVISRTDD